MKIEKGIISSSQLMFMIIGFIQASNLLLSFSGGVLSKDVWLAILAALAISIPFALSYAALAEEFPGKSLIQISDIIYGVYLGKLISVSYILIFLALVSLNLRFFSDFLITFIFVETPLWAILTMLTFVSAWAVRAGIEVIARCSFIILVISSITIIVNPLLLAGDMRFVNFLPILDRPFKDFIQGTHIILSIHFLEIVAFLMVIAFVKETKLVKRSILWGLIAGGVSILIVEVRNIAVLGKIADIVTSPSFEAVRYISVAEVFTRMEMLVAIMLVVTVFLKVSILYYATALGLAQTLKLRSYVPLVIPIGIIAIAISILVESSMEQSYTGTYTWPVFILPFQLLPVLSLFIIKLRRISKKSGGK